MFYENNMLHSELNTLKTRVKAMQVCQCHNAFRFLRLRLIWCYFTLGNHRRVTRKEYQSSNGKRNR